MTALVSDERDGDERDGDERDGHERDGDERDGHERHGRHVERRGVLVCGVLVCHRIDKRGHPTSVEWTYWADVSEARHARDALTPCGRRCRDHTVVAVDVTPRRSQGAG